MTVLYFAQTDDMRNPAFARRYNRFVDIVSFLNKPPHVPVICSCGSKRIIVRIRVVFGIEKVFHIVKHHLKFL
jgi:hypothetical protein